MAHKKFPLTYKQLSTLFFLLKNIKIYKRAASESTSSNVTKEQVENKGNEWASEKVIVRMEIMAKSCLNLLLINTCLVNKHWICLSERGGASLSICSE